MKLRDFQSDAVEAALTGFETQASQLMVLPTGTGKTVCFGHLIDRMKDRGRAIVMAHRYELLEQAKDKIQRITQLQIDVEMAEQRADERYGGLWDCKAPVIVTSVQTQASGSTQRRRMHRFDPYEFALMVADEAHHSTSPQNRTVIDYYRTNPNLKLLGVTATPNRTDEAALGQIFANVCYEMSILEAIELGWLVDIEQISIFVEAIDLTQCGATKKDLNGRDLATVMEYEEVLHGIAGPLMELSKGMKTLVFAASVDAAERLAEILRRHNPGSAQCVSNEKKHERPQIISDFRRGAFQTLVNFAITTEGFDVSDIGCVAIARPTKSLPLYTQMLGRGTRTVCPEIETAADAAERRAFIAKSSKPNLLLLDFAGNAGKHKLVTVMDALGGNFDQDVVDLASREAVEHGVRQNVQEALANAEQRNAEQRKAEASRVGIRGRSRYSTKVINPFEVLDVTEIREPGWHKGREPSGRMLQALANFKVPLPKELTYWQAKRLIGRLIERANNERCTFPQKKKLQQFGVKKDVSFQEARDLLDCIAANGWRRPAQWPDRLAGILFEKGRVEAIVD